MSSSLILHSPEICVSSRAVVLVACVRVLMQPSSPSCGSGRNRTLLFDPLAHAWPKASDKGTVKNNVRGDQSKGHQG